jgi:hypothetical protein
MSKSRVIKPFYLALVLVFGVTSALCAEVEKSIPVEQYTESSLFKSFMRRIGSRAKTFQAEYLPSVDSVFYPFGGPDLLHPLLLFPDATKFVLVGLELPGAELNPRNTDATFTKINSLLRRGFFVTADMGKSFKADSGVRAALGLQILLMGGSIKSDELIDPNTVRIVFDWQDREREVFFLRRNLVTQADSVAEFLSVNGIKGVCLMKATSYSPHRPMFNSLIDVVLREFDHIVQDDTGVPYKKLKDFDVQIFGRYMKPYGKEWRGYEQPKLKTLFDENPETPHLNFCYGYGCGRTEANMLLASRKVEDSPK